MDVELCCVGIGTVGDGCWLETAGLVVEKNDMKRQKADHLFPSGVGPDGVAWSVKKLHQ